MNLNCSITSPEFGACVDDEGADSKPGRRGSARRSWRTWSHKQHRNPGLDSQGKVETVSLFGDDFSAGYIASDCLHNS